MKGNQFSRNLYLSSLPSSAGRSMHRSMYVNRPKQAGRKSMRVDDGLKTDMVRILGCVKQTPNGFGNLVSEKLGQTIKVACTATGMDIAEDIS
jgi:hypothetical protein